VRDLTHVGFVQGVRRQSRELFPPCRRTYPQSMAMKGLLTSRPELRWFAVAVPTVLLAHWMFTALCPRLMAMLPYSLRAVLHLL
jgi:hypothetical protein